MNRKNAIFAMIIGSALCLTGALLLGILVENGGLNQQGAVVGIIYGLWSVFGILIGRNVYRNDPTRLKKLLVFMGLWMLLGLFIWFSLMMPYLEMRPKQGFIPVLAGILWSATVAMIYLGYQQSRGS